MTPRFNLDEYETVDVRIDRFYAKYPQGRIITELLHRDEREFIVMAYAYRDAADDFVAATGMAQEIIGASPVNKTSALENCETSAIGRCLANLNFAAKGQRASREEMAKVNRGVERVPDPGLPAAPLVSEASAERIIELGSRLKGLIGEDAARAAYVEARDAVAPAGSALLEEHAVRIITSLELALSLATDSADTPPADSVTVVAPGSDGPRVPTPPVAPKPVSKAQRGVLDKLREELVGLRGGPRADEVWFELLSVQSVQSVDELSSVQAGEMEASLRLEVKQAAEFVPPPVVQQALTEKAS